MKNMIVVFGIFLIASCKQECKGPKENMTKEVETVSQAAESDKKKPFSPHTETMTMVGDAQIPIDYSSPGVRNRKIFDGLLPFNASDVGLRLKVTPKTTEEIKEHLEYRIVKATETSGTISMSWKKVSIEFPFKIE